MPEKKICPSAADSRNIVNLGRARFTVLTTRLIRMEYDPEGVFEDRPTRMVLNRNFPAAGFKAKRSGEGVTIETDDLTLYYHGGPFSAHSLEVSLKADCHVHGSRWHFSQKQNTLKGTCRTLDEADGAVPLDEGLVSRDGYAFLDDSDSMVFEGDQMVPADRPGCVDGYFFGYARDYFGALKDFLLLSGGTPRLPRYALGNWWSRYWAYTQDEFLSLTDSFREEHIPFSVFVMDMDWHLVDVDERFGGGWTGYSWNRELIHSPRELLKELHRRNYRVTLNLHPASGVRAYEDAYRQMATALGVDPDSEETLPLRLEDPDFLAAYFHYLHHPLEEEGVDFWWIDWQQGSVSTKPGVDPLWLLNHYHSEDMVKRGREPLILSRYAGPGSHRYPVGFSGDTVISWDSLAFQPYFTSTAANIGYNWWSHDIGGHMQGVRDGELSVRWLQFGVFSPVNRLHSSRSLFNSKEPSSFPAEERRVMGHYLRLRHRLIPYIYSLSVRLSNEGRPFLTPLYYHYPDSEESYDSPGQYFFGDHLMICPLVQPMDRHLKLTEAEVWLPEGLWFDFFSGRACSSGRTLMYRTLENQLVLAEAGAVVPMDRREDGDNDTDNPGELEWLLFAGGDGEFTLVEEGPDGDALTRLENRLGTKQEIILHKSAGCLEALPSERSVSIRVRGIEEPSAVMINGRLCGAAVYDDKTRSVIFELEGYDSSIDYKIEIKAEVYCNREWRKDVFQMLHRAEIEYSVKEKIFALCQEGEGESLLTRLNALKLNPTLFSALCELISS